MEKFLEDQPERALAGRNVNEIMQAMKYTTKNRSPGWGKRIKDSSQNWQRKDLNPRALIKDFSEDQAPYTTSAILESYKRWLPCANYQLNTQVP